VDSAIRPKLISSLTIATDVPRAPAVC